MKFPCNITITRSELLLIISSHGDDLHFIFIQKIPTIAIDRIGFMSSTGLKTVITVNVLEIVNFIQLGKGLPLPSCIKFTINTSHRLKNLSRLNQIRLIEELRTSLLCARAWLFRILEKN